MTELDYLKERSASKNRGLAILNPKRVIKLDPKEHKEYLKEARRQNKAYCASKRTALQNKRRKAAKVAKQSRKRNRH